MVHFDFELPKTRPKGKPAEVEDGVTIIAGTLQCRKAAERSREYTAAPVC